VEFPVNFLFYGILAVVGLVVFSRLILPQLEEKYEGITKLWNGFWSVIASLLMILGLLTECVK
jgi:type II secretory pathway component PulF